MSKAGNIEIDVWVGGYPVWCHISYRGAEKFSIHHNELSDLLYATQKAMKEAKLELSDKDKEEV